MKTEGFTPNVAWRPFMEAGRVGFVCTNLETGVEWFVYLQPSTSGDGAPDVFLYTGRHNDPVKDYPEVFYTPEF
jgi:hypothetical protein